MARRYHTVASRACGASFAYCADDSEQVSQPLTISVITDEPEPYWTGLYNADGHKIMAVNTRDPIGFVWFE